MTDEDRLRELEAYEQIRRLAADYCHGIDKRDRERFAAVWDDDARWQPMPDMPWLEGRDTIVGALDGIWQAFASTHHWTTNHSIRVHGDTATALADADCVVADADGAWSRIAASYEDTYARRDDGWRITSRIAQIHHSVPIAEP